VFIVAGNDEKMHGNKFILVELRNQNWTGCLSISLLRFEP
jgi:hypothetical protein